MIEVSHRNTITPFLVVLFTMETDLGVSSWRLSAMLEPCTTASGARAGPFLIAVRHRNDRDAIET